MTNAMIILLEQIRLLDEGKIKTTGNVLTYIDADGEHQISEPEPIHTFAHWKSLGYCVKKGEKAVAKFGIWKYRAKADENEEGQQIDENKMFIKLSSFFSQSQVERIST